jgi:hypothetical protein
VKAFNLCCLQFHLLNLLCVTRISQFIDCIYIYLVFPNRPITFFKNIEVFDLQHNSILSLNFTYSNEFVNHMRCDLFGIQSNRFVNPIDCWQLDMLLRRLLWFCSSIFIFISIIFSLLRFYSKKRLGFLDRGF